MKHYYDFIFFRFLQEIIFINGLALITNVHVDAIYSLFTLLITNIHIFMRVIYLKQGLYDLHHSLGSK